MGRRLVEGIEAIECGDVANVKKLLRECPSLMGFLLYTAARIGDHRIVQLLLSRCKPNLTETDENGWTALQLAAHGGHHKVVKVLLASCVATRHVQSRKRPRKETEPTAAVCKSQQSRTALHLAADGGHHKVVELLLPHCSESTLNAVDIGNHTALALAVLGGHLNVVQLFVAEQLSLAGSLELAVMSGYDNILKFLLGSTEIVASDHDMWQAMHRAVLDGNVNHVKLLIKAKPELLSEESLFEALYNDDLRMFLVLLDECERMKGPDCVCELLAKRRNPRGLTILHRALQLHDGSFSGALISKLLKFKWQQQTSVDPANGNTLLHDAALSQHFNSQVLEKVLAMDPIALRRANSYNWTPFDVAARWHDNAAVMSRKMPLEVLLTYRDFARKRLPALVEEFVRAPLLLELHRDVVGVVCGYLSSSISIP